MFHVQFTHAVRFDHLVVCGGKDLVALLCGPNPTSQYGQGSDNRFCEPGLSCYLIKHLQKCKLFLRNRKHHSGRKFDHYFSSQAREGIWILCLYFPFYDFED